MSRKAVECPSVGATARGDSDAGYARDQEIRDFTGIGVLGNASLRLRLANRLRNIVPQSPRGGVPNFGKFGFAATELTD